MNDMWFNDRVQFPRLLAEINAVGLTDAQVKAVAESMDVNVSMVRDLLRRAERALDRIKRDRSKA